MMQQPPAGRRTTLMRRHQQPNGAPLPSITEVMADEGYGSDMQLPLPRELSGSLDFQPTTTRAPPGGAANVINPLAAVHLDGGLSGSPSTAVHFKSTGPGRSGASADGGSGGDGGGAAAAAGGRTSVLYQQLVAESTMFSYEDVVVSFNWLRWFEMLLIHAFQPLSLIYVIPRFGPQGGVNLRLMPPFTPWDLLTQVTALFMLLFPLTFVFQPELHEHWPGMKPMWAISFAYGFVRNAVIALKYGTFPQSMFFLFMTVDRDTARSIGDRETLSTGWARPNPEHIVREIQISALQNNILLKAQQFHVRASVLPQVKDLLRPVNFIAELNDGVVPCNDGYMVSLLPVAAALIVNARDRFPTVWPYLSCIFLALVHTGHAMTWTVVISIKDTGLMVGWLEISCLVMLGMNMVVQFGALLAFLVIAIGDVHRRFRGLAGLRKLTSSRVVKGAVDFQRQRPTIDMLDPVNPSVWYHCRTLVTTVGSRYHNRLQAYMSAVTIVIGALMIVLIAQNFDPAYAGSMVLKMYTQLTLTLCVAMFFATVAYMFCGAMANRETGFQLQLCADTNLSITALLANGDLPEAAVASLEAAVESLGAAESAVERRDERAPIRVLGFRADFSTLQAFIGFVVSIVSVGANYLPSPF